MTISTTRYKELNYEQHAPGLWRIIDASTGAAVGPHYPTKAELLADLDRFYGEFAGGNAHAEKAAELEAYQRLHDGLSDMIEGGRLTEADIPDDYLWLADTLAALAAGRPERVTAPEPYAGKVGLFNETLADIAFAAGAAGYYSGNSREDMSTFISWAHEFERNLKGFDYNDQGDTEPFRDYMIEVEEFVNAKMHEEGHAGNLKSAEQEPVPDERTAEIVAMAKAEHQEDGECEIDSNAKLSEGDDNGTYVQAWVWVNFAGTKFDKENGSDA